MLPMGKIKSPIIRSALYGPIAGVGGVAISSSTGDWSSSRPNDFVQVPNLDVSIVTRGGPVEVYLVPSTPPPPQDTYSHIFAQRDSKQQNGMEAKSAALIIQLYRDTIPVAAVEQHDVNKRSILSSDVNLTVSPSVFRFIDTPPSGNYRYIIKARSGAGNNGNSSSEKLRFYHICLVAREI